MSHKKAEVLTSMFSRLCISLSLAVATSNDYQTFLVKLYKTKKYSSR